MNQSSISPPFSKLLQDFFCKRLVNQRNASHCTVQAYRDTFRLLLRYLEEHHKVKSCEVTLADLDASRILAFLDYLEDVRKNSIRSRNSRLAAVRSFMNYAAAQDPASLPIIHRVLAIPVKRFDRPLLGFLSRDEIQAILNAPDASTWSGQRDRAMLTLLYNTGARVSEVTSMCVADVSLDQSSSVCIRGKGRKARSIPLWKTTASVMRQWKKQIGTTPQSPLLPNASGNHLSRSGVESRLKRAIKTAINTQPSLSGRTISPHTIRHTTAMHLLQAGVDISVIALWLGHESTTTTHMYIEADLAMKDRALQKLEPTSPSRNRFKPSSKLLQFLDGL